MCLTALDRAHRLPTLSKETETLLAECEDRLAALPPLITSEPTSFVLGLVHKFCAEFKSYVEGHSLTATLVQDNSRTYRQFQKRMRATAPHFIPFDDKARAEGHIQQLFSLERNEDLTGMTFRYEDMITITEVRQRIKKYVFIQLAAVSRIN